MLNDKHIEQWASYLLEELPNYEELIKDKELETILIEMYKKGYNDCLQDNYATQLILPTL
jgi:hypothetical protein